MDTKDEGPDIFGRHIDGVQIRDLSVVMASYIRLQKEGKMTNIAICKMNDIYRQKTKDFLNGEKATKNFSSFIEKKIGTKYKFNVIDQMYVPFHTYFLIRKIKEIKDYFYFLC